MAALLAQLHSSRAQWIELLGIPVGVLWMIFGLQCFWKSLTVKDWTPVEGMILRSDIRRRRYYQARVRYRYSFEGLALEGDRIRILDDLFFFKSSAQDAASQYKPQETVTVWVNPRNPKNAVLEPAPQPLLSLFHAVLGIFVVWVSLSKVLG